MFRFHPWLNVRRAAIAASWTALLTSALLAGSQGSPLTARQAKPDFARDVQPLLKEHCFRCHGPTEQKNGYRLDRRSRAMHGATRANIIPGSSESSRLYLRISGSQFGTQMPAEGSLTPEEITILKTWIDQGAEWPDALANEAEWVAPDPRAVRWNDAIRRRNREAVLAELARTPAAVNGAGTDGSTPLMTAALYGDTDLVERMIAAGANPNVENHAGATALMWALPHADIVGLLLKHGADPNAMSDLAKTPLQIAAAQRFSGPVVKLLIDHGAEARLSSLVAAAAAANADVVRLLLQADVQDNGDAISAALRSDCADCIEAIGRSQPFPRLRNALVTLLPPIGSGRVSAVRLALERGAEVNIRDRRGLTPLLKAAIVESAPSEVLRLLMDHGGDLRATNAEGATALTFARRTGDAPAIESLVRAGAVAAADADAPRGFVGARNTTQAAVRRSLPILQQAGVQFYKKSGCVSCHSNLLTAMTTTAARPKGFAVDESIAREEAAILARDTTNTRDQALEGIVMPGGGPATTGYVLMALAAQRYEADAATDALVRLLILSQKPDGRWSIAFRPPSESSEFTATAVAIRGMRLYAAGDLRGSADRAIADAVRWLTSARPETTEDRVFRVFGLRWGGASTATLRAAIADLLATERPDGGWSQLPGLASDAYATGATLVALHDAGVPVNALAYRRGVKFLLATQLDDGSWFVRTRAHPTQVFFDSGFPHRTNQYISTAATNWATLALIAAR